MISLEKLNEVTKSIAGEDKSEKLNSVIDPKTLFDSILARSNARLMKDSGVLLDHTQLMSILVVTQVSITIGYLIGKEENNASTQTSTHIPSE